MHRTPFILTTAAMCALAACTQSAPGNAPAAPPGNDPAPAAPAAPPPPATGNTAGNEAAPANGLWGVADEEDAASHRGIDFVAFNRTGQTVTGLSLRPDEGPLDAGAEETPWTSNILAQRELPDGSRAAAHYEADIEICHWQLRATFADRRTRDYPSIDLCSTIRVDLR